MIQNFDLRILFQSVVILYFNNHRYYGYTDKKIKPDRIPDQFAG
jgi:hypothetical protein